MSSLVREAFLAVRKHPESDLIFPGSDPKKPLDWRKPFKVAVKKAKLNESGKEKLVFHHLRHTFCSQLGLLGYDVKSIMELSGHKSYEMALRYIKLNPEHNAKALERLEAKIGLQNIRNRDEESKPSGTKSGTKTFETSHEELKNKVLGP